MNAGKCDRPTVVFDNIIRKQKGSGSRRATKFYTCERFEQVANASERKPFFVKSAFSTLTRMDLLTLMRDPLPGGGGVPGPRGPTKITAIAVGDTHTYKNLHKYLRFINHLHHTL